MPPLPLGEGRGEGPMAKIKNYNQQIIVNARNLRKNSTPWERKLWSFLKSSKFYGFKFRRQFPIGNYIADFCCINAKLVIELDGGQHSEDINKKSDANRDAFFEKQRYRIFRIWNNEIDRNLEGVGEKLYQMLMDPHP